MNFFHAAKRSFVLILLVFAILGYVLPEIFSKLIPHLKLLLSLIMFSMGMTLKTGDFKLVLTKPFPVIVGVLAQFLIMPVLAFAIALVFGLSPELAAGLVLVGSCPGGTASNVMVYLSRGDLALSVVMTTISTLLAPIMIPLWIFTLAQKWISVDFWSLMGSAAQIVLLPILLGLLANIFFKKTVERLVDYVPSLAVYSIALIIAALVAVNSSKMLELYGLHLLFLAVILHNLLGLILGYAFARLLSLPQAQIRTIALEVAMQNSGLGAVLALAYFGPIAALPSIIFSIWHNLSGAAIAGYWSRKN